MVSVDFQRKLSRILAGLLLLGILGAFVSLALRQRGGVDVSVVNESGGAVREVNLRFSGGNAAVGEIRAGERRNVRVAPKWKSGLEMEYLEASGKRYVEKVDVYLAPGFSGNITIWIREGGDVRWKNEVKISDMDLVPRVWERK
jgi:hypothetical protein